MWTRGGSQFNAWLCSPLIGNSKWGFIRKLYDKGMYKCDYKELQEGVLAEKCSVLYDNGEPHASFGEI